MNRCKKIAVVLSIAVFFLYSFAKTVQAGELDNANQYWPDGPEIQSASGIIMEANTGTILYEKNIHDVHYPASITKILTTLLAIENSEMDEIVTFSNDSVYKTEGSGIARDVGEQMTMEQCLYGVMLASANECAYAVAEHVGGTIDNFIRMMNERAAAIGCKNTNFNNCNGLPDENHYTSAYDMALIAREAFQNETFRIICGTKTYTIPFTNKHTTEETYLQNHHQMLYPLKTAKYLYDYCLGGKTGYTSAANYTLVTYAEKDGVVLICVVLNAPAGGNYEDTRALFDFCFDNFKTVNISEEETSFSKSESNQEGVWVDYEPFVALDSSASVILPITAEFADTDSKIVYDDANEDILGSIEYTYAGRLVGKADLRATNANVESFKFNNKENYNSDAESTEELLSKIDNKKDDVFRLDVKVILAVLCGIVLFLAGIFLAWKFIDNFYIIRRKLQLKKRERPSYKIIKKNKMYRRKKHRWF